MRSSIKNIAFLILGGLIAASLLLLAFRMPWAFQNNHVTNSLDNPFEGMSLVAPPAYAVEATSTTPPLNTSKISFIAYYQRVGGWTLADTVPAFVSYFDGGNYYDGLVRVWEGSDTYLDVQVRVRADGWILAWFDRYLDDPAAIVYWGHGRSETGAPPSYSTTLSRAMEIVFNVASVGFPGYNLIGMYDYSELNATRLLIFGDSISGSTTHTYYYTIPANSTIIPIKLLIRAGGYLGMGNYARLYVDDGLIYDENQPPYTHDRIWGWSTYQIDAYSKGIQHKVEQSGYGVVRNNVAFIMWSG